MQPSGKSDGGTKKRPANDAGKVVRLIPGSAATAEALKKRYQEAARGNKPGY